MDTLTWNASDVALFAVKPASVGINLLGDFLFISLINVQQPSALVDSGRSLD